MTTVIELLQEVRRLISIVIEIGRILCPRHCQRQSLRNAVIACGGCFKSLMFKTTSILCPRAYTSTAHVTKIQIEPLLHTLTISQVPEGACMPMRFDPIASDPKLALEHGRYPRANNRL